MYMWLLLRLVSVLWRAIVKLGLINTMVGWFSVITMVDRSFFSVFLYLELCVMGMFFCFRMHEGAVEVRGERRVVFIVVKLCEARAGLGILVMLARAAVKNYEGGGVNFNMLLWL